MSEAADTGAGPEAPEVGADGGEAGDITPPPAGEWWQFGSKSAAEQWANKLVETRLSRHKKTNVDPIVAERDTLKAEVEQLRPLKEATQTDSERWESKLNQVTTELEELRSYRSENERKNLVRNIADEMGLPASFLGRVSGNDEDAIREDIQSVLDALSEGGFNTGKKAPPQKNPKPAGNGSGSVGSGGGSDQDEPDDDAQVASILEAAKKSRQFGGLIGSRR